MSNQYLLYGFFTILFILVFFVIKNFKCCEKKSLNIDFSNIFIKNFEDLNNKKNEFYINAKKIKDEILSLKNNELDYSKLFDLINDLNVEISFWGDATDLGGTVDFDGPAEFYTQVGLDCELKISVGKAMHEIGEWFNYEFLYNQDIYLYIKKAADELLKDEKISNETRRFIESTLNIFKRIGAGLSEENRKNLSDIQNKINENVFNFEQNLYNDKRELLCDISEIDGISESFIKSLKKNEYGKLVLKLNYPTAREISYCKNRETRKKFYNLYKIRGHPNNLKILQNLRELRNDYAKILGYNDFCSLNIETGMPKKVDIIKIFLNEIHLIAEERAIKEKKITEDFIDENLRDEIPDNIMPWDLGYINKIYEKKVFNLDFKKISEYFPLQQTINKCLELYAKFFDINLTRENCGNEAWAWSEYLEKITVSEKNGNILGYIIFDPYPRDGKYNHACCTMIVQGQKDKYGNLIKYPVAALVCNFTLPTEEHDGLLSYGEVVTFFHEFGHGLHDVFSSCKYITQTIVGVSSDFVEMPSQFFEQVLDEPEIIKFMSGHYKTGEKLSDEIIASMIARDSFGKGFSYDGQFGLASFALEIFDENINSDIHAIAKKHFYKKYALTPYDDENYFECSFGHIANSAYASKYYSYLWSKVYALDIYQEIKDRNGLKNNSAFVDFKNLILSKGCTEDYKEMMINFLGRLPSTSAFFKDMNK